MKRWFQWLAVFVLFELSAYPCGPDFPTAIFVTTDHPGGDYAVFAKGHIGIPQKNYRTRDLVLIYNDLTGRELTDEEQEQAVKVQDHYMETWRETNQEQKSAPTALDRWLAARSGFGTLEKIDNSLDTVDYESVTNCLDGAFTNAAATLAARIKAYGRSNPAVIEWVRGQDAVFAQCDQGRPRFFFGPGKPPPPPAPPQPPAAVPASAPVWLQQDRAYQLAAAHFYATDYTAAIADFRAIAADAASPWSSTARYLIARCLIRKATLIDSRYSTAAGGDSAKEQAAANARMIAGLKLAQAELVAMQAEPRMATMQHAMEGLLDYVNLRLQPDTQAVVLAQRLHSPKRDHYAQSVIDLTYLRVGGYGDVKTIGEPALKEDPTGMLGWIEAFHEGNETKSLAEWRATRNTAWLLAAISFAQPSDAAAPELIRAAASIPKSSPAWMAITYHRLRLLPRDEAKRKEVLALLPEIRKSESQSTINLFTALDHATAPTLQTWLASAAREPAAESWWDDEEEAVAVTAGQEDVCGHKTTTTRLFDLDASYALNQWFPLRTLALAAESGELPENLRYQVAQAAWARAVLLDQPAIAHRMTPLLISCRAAWKPVLDTYDASKSDEDRKANGLLALMRFASVEPSVRYGEERRMGFATYDEYRQNWWCSAVPPNNDDVPGTVDQRSITPSQPLSDAPPKPLFLTPSDTAEAEAELARLRKVPSAAAYFASEALAWQKLHPGDPRAADLLGEAFRVERNSCGDKSTSELIHRVFDVLNHSYPKSAWTKRYTTWE